MSAPPGDPGRCRYCHAPFRWVRMTNTGRSNPVNPEPDEERGNIAIDADTGEGHQLGAEKAGALRELDVPLYLSHWASCPKRDKAARDRDRKKSR